MNSLRLFILFLLFPVLLWAQTPWTENDPGTTDQEIFREGPVGIGTFSIPDVPSWPGFPLHIVGYQESSESSSNAPRIQLEHSYLTSSGGSNNTNEENGPGVGIQGSERHFVGWGVENRNGILKFIRDGNPKVEIGSTKLMIGNSTEDCDLQLFGDAVLGHPAGGDRIEIYSDVTFHASTSFGNTVNFLDKLVIGDSYSGNSNFELSVDGNILCQEVTVETVEQWNDHVFDQDYNLMTLDQLRSFIKENKHLPEIPDQNEVKTNGYNLVEMDALLLKKIEELTLYILNSP